MNAHIAQALLRDAVYQVLASWVFRILVLLALILVATTFLVGFREEGVVLAGLHTTSWESLAAAFDETLSPADIADMPRNLVEAITQIFVDYVAGMLGMGLCIAATAFFIPEMIQKGAADVVFHKPVSRLVFYLSRYFAGLIFVATLSTLLVTGMFLGFTVASDHSDPALLWSALSLTYVFAMLHGVSMLAGVVTRSSIAAILLTLLFFFANGCVQNIWVGTQQLSAMAEELEALTQDELEGEVEEEEEDDNALLDTVVDVLVFGRDAWHYVMPKTMDAPVITKKMRAYVSADAPLFEDEESGILVEDLPFEGRVLEDPAAGWSRPEEIAALYGQAIFGAESSDGLATVRVFRRDRRELPVGTSGKLRPESKSRAARDLTDALMSLAADASVESESGRAGPRDTMSATVIRWARLEEGARHEMRTVLLRAPDHVLLLESDLAPGATEEPDDLERDFSREAGIPVSSAQNDWYEEQLALDAELKFNILFSIGSSLAFAAAVLLIGWWRLNKIDF